MSKEARRKEKAAMNAAAAEEKKKAAKDETVKVEPVKVEPVKKEAEKPSFRVKPEEAKAVKAEVKPKPEKMTVAKLTEICHTLAEATKECKVDLRDHEERLVKLEEKVFGTDSEPASGDLDVVVSTEFEKESESKPVPEPVSEKKMKPVPESKSLPVAEPAPAAEPEVQPVGFNGVGIAYKFRRSNGRICITPSRSAADQASGGIFKKIFVEYIDGQINHVLTEDEMAKAGLIMEA